MPKIRVLIVDDSVVIRKLVSDCLSQDPEIEIAGTAADGKIALAKIAQVNPDIITLDIEMPVLDGLETLKALRKLYPRLPVIMFSTLTERGGHATLDALALGASDYVTKPANVGSVNAALQRIHEELIPKIKGFCRPAPQIISPSIVRPPTPRPAAASAGLDVVAIGVSTGGPNALAALMPGLMKNFPVPIVIVQHMPALFTRLLAERLQAVSGIPSQEGAESVLLKSGHVWVAPGGFHMEVQGAKDGTRLHLHDGPAENSCRPAVDVLFRSVARVFGGRSLGVILTGMGQDGLRGSENIREAGGQILAQDEKSSIVWGMPGAVTKAGLADKVLPLDELAAEINRRVLAARPIPHKSAASPAEALVPQLP